MSENVETGAASVVNEEVAEMQRAISEYNRQQKEAKTGSNGRLTAEELKKKMFNTREPEEQFRILPFPKGKMFFEEAYFHNMEITVNGGNKKQWSKIYCPRHNDPHVPLLNDKGEIVLDQNGKQILVQAKCPLCEKSEALLETQSGKFFKKDQQLTIEEKKIKDKDLEIFKQANAYKADLFFIVKGIDRGSQKDGVKFWRYKKSFNGQGVDEKLKTCYYNYLKRKDKNYASITDGCDVFINVIDAKMPNGTLYKSVTAIDAGDASKLHEDQSVVNSWLNDPITWKEVYRPKIAPNVNSYEYLEMVALGIEPYWNDTEPTNKHWVFPGRPDLEQKANTRDENHSSEPPQTQPVNLSQGVTDMCASFKATPVTPVVQPDPVYTKQVMVEETAKAEIVVDMDDLPF